MATNNTPVSVGARREVPLQAPGTAISTADTNQWDLNNIPEEVAGIILVINVTAATGASITPKIYGRDAVSGAVWQILAGTAITAPGVTVLKVHDSLTAAANTVANDVVGEHIRVELANTTGSATYSVVAELIY